MYFCLSGLIPEPNKMKKALTELERYILTLAAWNDNPPDWEKLYFATREKPSRATAQSFSQIVCNWKNSFIVKSFFQEEQNQFKDWKRRQAQKAIEINKTDEGGRETGKGAKPDKNKLLVDFSNRDELINYLNQKANETDDEKTKADYIKTLADLLQFKKDQNQGDKTEIQRFYTPLQCANCKLYQEKHSK
jgi:hypothetical protein